MMYSQSGDQLDIQEVIQMKLTPDEDQHLIVMYRNRFIDQDEDSMFEGVEEKTMEEFKISKIEIN